MHLNYSTSAIAVSTGNTNMNFVPVRSPSQLPVSPVAGRECVGRNQLKPIAPIKVLRCSFFIPHVEPGIRSPRCCN